MSATGPTGFAVSGGAGGVSAHYDDLHALAGMLRAGAVTLREALADAARAAVDPALAASFALSPGSALEAEGALLSAAGPDGLGGAAFATEGLARALQAAVAAYRAADEALALGRDAALNGVGVAVGAALPVVAPVAAPALALGGAGGLERLADPALVEPLAAGLPGVAAGLGLWAPLPRGSRAGPRAVTFDGALRSPRGLLPAGRPALTAGGSAQPGDVVAPRGVGDLLRGVGRRQRRSAGAAPGEIGVRRLTAPDGTVRYVVELPGTESWALRPGPRVRDLATNVHAVSGRPTAYAHGVVAALEAAGVPPDAPVLLVGHSQGGIVAAGLAADPAVRRRFRVAAVVTAGSPLGRLPSGHGVPVLALEDRGDLVPALDGRPNRAGRDLTTVRFDSVPSTTGGKHALDGYARAAERLPHEDPSVRAWGKAASGFFVPGTVARQERYAVQRAGD
ncbi:alpha/beta hydrolase family protein [Motilibacter aurantiacus]|uniref:hypothetical protein n=1 Tax=Motilibacter aurantiacus TaxID=2714955 RepID=UPI001408FD15|nr:hypothetical protein [Motilibacter aurantiacus]NHC47610.1 hypothetical protein [Motilibacter aurantiacus]